MSLVCIDRFSPNFLTPLMHLGKKMNCLASGLQLKGWGHQVKSYGTRGCISSSNFLVLKVSASILTKVSLATLLFELFGVGRTSRIGSLLSSWHASSL